MEFTFQNLNVASIELSRELLSKGKSRHTRGFDCIEFTEPVMVHITNPTDRYINIKERKHHKYLPFAESLALASGVNDLSLYAGYVPSMSEYSDNGQFMRAGYGPRIRAYTGNMADYAISQPEHRNVYAGYTVVIDQLRYVIETLKKDINSRQAVIQIADPAKDCFGENGALLVTKDQPCSRLLHFQVVDGKLDLTLYIRSNDFIFGFQAVNVFNFTFMQEYVANILGLPIGTYHHVAGNLHFYVDKLDLIKTLAGLNTADYESEFGVWQYPFEINNLVSFDYHLTDLFTYEQGLRKGEEMMPFWEEEMTPAFFEDWGMMFKKYWTKQPQQFHNPYLQRLFNGK